MRNFDYLQELGLNALHKFCATAEELQVSNPDLSAISARKALEYMVKSLYLINSRSLEGLALAKACLYAGNIKYEKGDLDGAAALFQKSLDNAGSVVLVRSAALHGLASVKMEKGDYTAAAGLLEKFVSEFGKRTGDLQDRYEKDEPVDETPMVADAMWKLTLVYDKLGQADKAKATAERLLKVYGDNMQFADKASKFLGK